MQPITPPDPDAIRRTMDMIHESAVSGAEFRAAAETVHHKIEAAIYEEIAAWLDVPADEPSTDHDNEVRFEFRRGVAKQLRMVADNRLMLARNTHHLHASPGGLVALSEAEDAVKAATDRQEF